MAEIDKSLDLPLEERLGKRRSSGPFARSDLLFRLLLSGATLAVALLILLPVAALVLESSAGDIIRLLRDPTTLAALRVTLASSLLSGALVFMLGLPAAYALSRHLGRGRRIFESLLELPMVMPPIVAGLALLLAFGRHGLVGSQLLPFGVQIPFTLCAVILAQVFIITPHFIKRTAVHFDGVDRRLETAAALLGAGPFYSFLHVTLPLCRRSLLAEGIMVFAQGIGMFGAVILFAGNLPGRTQTLSLAIYGAFQSDPRQAFALSTLLLGISCVLLILCRLVGRSGGVDE